MLFINNTAVRAPLAGFDAKHHLGYINYIQQKHELPKADAGWETHQPPLYYLVAAGTLKLAGLGVDTPEGLMGLRALSLLSGLGQIFLVFASLRVVFPDELRRPLLGTGMAALLPAHLYHAHYYTNETFLALLISGAFYLTLRALSGSAPWWVNAALGACLGAAALTKVSAVVVAPVFFATLALALIARRETRLKCWAGTLGVSLTTCALVCGWYYWGLWSRHGGLFDEASRWAYGSGWWQEDGYRTADYYWRFGQALVHPLFSGFHSFWDGLYSTLWGDGLGGGATSIEGRPPWNYDLFAVGYWLALVPTLAILVGCVVMARQLRLRPSGKTFLLLGVTAAFGLALVYFSLTAPGTSQVRASFGLMLLVPFCALFATGLDRLLARPGWLGTALLAVMVWWALNSYFAHWISGASAQTRIFRARAYMLNGQFAEAAQAAEEGLRVDPTKAMLRSILAGAWQQMGRTNEARELTAQSLARWPRDPISHLDAAYELSGAGQINAAVQETRTALALAPDDPTIARELTVLLVRQQQLGEALAACRNALRIRPHDESLRKWLNELEQGRGPTTEQR